MKGNTKAAPTIACQRPDLGEVDGSDPDDRVVRLDAAARARPALWTRPRHRPHGDPLGLALENFNAMGMQREKERGQLLFRAGPAGLPAVPAAAVVAGFHPNPPST